MADLTFVIPFYNEEAFLRRTLQSLAEQDLGPYSAEVLLVDGRSQDRSREIAESFAGSAGQVSFRVLDNPRRRTPFAFNIGIGEARGRIVGLGGAHTDYPPHYLRRAVELLAEVDAEVVGGGHDRYLPADPGPLASAMSCLYQSPLGAGVAAYHRRSGPGYVDTVYGGFYRREVFERVGGFNERLLRNQDNELNARITSAGMRIYFHPDLSTTYIQKTDLPTFFRRGFMFGRYHPMTWRINPGSFRVRHLVPALFVIYLLVLGTASVGFGAPFWAWAPLLVYAALLLGSATRLSLRVGPAAAALTIPLFFLYHLAYGAGTIYGLISFRHLAPAEA